MIENIQTISKHTNIIYKEYAAGGIIYCSALCCMECLERGKDEDVPTETAQMKTLQLLTTSNS